MARSRPRPWLAGVSFSFAAIALLLCLASSAGAATGGAPTAAGAPAPSGSPTGTPAGEAPSTGALSLVSAQTTPRKSFFYGVRYPSVRFSIGSTQQQNDLQIDVVNSAGEVARSYYRNDVEPNVEMKIRWDGTTSEGRPARNGRYSFRIEPQGGTELARRPPDAGQVLGEVNHHHQPDRHRP